MAEPTGRTGFSLIEALVAIAVLGVVLGGAVAASGGSLEIAERSRRELAMAQLAESLLARAGLDLLGEAAVAEGRSGGLRWRLIRAREEPEGGGPIRTGEARATLWRITAEIEDEAGGRFALATLRLGGFR